MTHSLLWNRAWLRFVTKATCQSQRRGLLHWLFYWVTMCCTAIPSRYYATISIWLTCCPPRKVVGTQTESGFTDLTVPSYPYWTTWWEQGLILVVTADSSNILVAGSIISPVWELELWITARFYMSGLNIQHLPYGQKGFLLLLPRTLLEDESAVRGRTDMSQQLLKKSLAGGLFGWTLNPGSQKCPENPLWTQFLVIKLMSLGL